MDWTDELLLDTHDAGGRVTFPLKDGVEGFAEFYGEKQEYRPVLGRTWNNRLPVVMFVMMNPSTASPDKDDPTVAKCCKYAEGWDFGGILVGNTFDYRATDQKKLREVSKPSSDVNDEKLKDMAARAKVIVMAYGKPHPSLQYRGKEVTQLLRSMGKELHALKLCADGTPSHPLYLRGDLVPEVWQAYK